MAKVGLNKNERRDLVQGYVAPETAERAFRAVKRSRDMLPMLNAFARAITRDPNVRVSFHPGTPCTNGREIFLRPSMALGEVVSHDRVNCGRRDDNSWLLCPACAQVEEVQETLFHEMAHIVFDSFESVRDADRVQLLEKALAERPDMPGSRVEKLKRAIEGTPKSRGDSYIGVARLVSPYLPMLVNALEDARVNKAMYGARAGTFHMFRGKAIRVFTQGIEQPDGTVTKWSDMGENAQLLVGIYCKASGFDYQGWFSPRVVEALDDPELTVAVLRCATARTAASVYRAAFPILEIVRGLGFCKRIEDAEDDPTPEPTPEKVTVTVLDDAEPEDGDSDDAEITTVAAPADSDDDSDVEADGDSDDTETGTDDNGADDGPDGADGADDGADDDQPATGQLGADDGADDNGADGADDDQPAGSTEADDDEAEPSTSGVPEDEDDDDDDEEADDEQADGAFQGRLNEDPDDAEEALRKMGGHDQPSYNQQRQQERDDAEIDRALIQGDHFDAPSSTVFGLNVHRYDDAADHRQRELAWRYKEDGHEAEHVAAIMPSEATIGRSLMRLRRVFSDNRMAKRTNGHRSGRIVSNRLATVPAGNDRVFGRTQLPGKKDYFIAISLDVSGSTSGNRIIRIKEMGMALGEMLSRLDVDFVMYAHTGCSDERDSEFLAVDMFVVKDLNERWGAATRTRLAALNAASTNLDGHTLEFLRKRCDQSQATDKLILYVTDGAMPQSNFSDELVVLKREIKTCRQRGYNLLGVGINTESPKTHGLDTVRLDSSDDLPVLITELERRLAGVGHR